MEEMKSRQVEAIREREMLLARKDREELNLEKQKEQAKELKKEKQKQQIKTLSFNVDDEEDGNEDEDSGNFQPEEKPSSVSSDRESPRKSVSVCS